MTRTAVELHITGRVQGVSFRYYTQREAQRLGVTGWVRNEPDGSVRAHLEGDREAVSELVRWCHEGPTYARVTGVSVTPAADTGAASFKIGF